MNICITSTGKDLKAPVDHRFGRCSWFIFYNTQTAKYRAVKNSPDNCSRGAGVRSAQIVAASGPHALITGNLGFKASSFLLECEIKIYSFENGTVRDALHAFNEGKLREITPAAEEPVGIAAAGCGGSSAAESQE